MNVKIIGFKAYDAPGARIFLDKSYEDVHKELNDLCNTYVVTSIIEAGEAEFKPLTNLTDIQKQHADSDNKK